jgi:hypothetical protein
MTKETRPLITEDNIATGETVIRPMTDEEYATYLNIKNAHETE